MRLAISEYDTKNMVLQRDCDQYYKTQGLSLKYLKKLLLYHSCWNQECQSHSRINIIWKWFGSPFCHIPVYIDLEFVVSHFYFLYDWTAGGDNAPKEALKVDYYEYFVSTVSNDQVERVGKWNERRIAQLNIMISSSFDYDMPSHTHTYTHVATCNTDNVKTYTTIHYNNHSVCIADIASLFHV